MTSTIARPALVRPRTMVLGGVSVALARHLGWRVSSIRIAAIVLSPLLASVLLYLWLWALVPTEGGDEPIRRRTPVAALLTTAAGIATVVVFAAANGHDAGITAALFVVTLTAGGAVAWSLTLDRADESRDAKYALTVRIVTITLLAASGITALSTRPSALNAVFGVAMILLAAAVLAAPRVVQLWSELMGERAARVRQEQRAEIAAHLHDSVLQTLALIQNRAGASSEVARIARAQERELRDWLFAADEPENSDLGTQLRDVAAAIELDHAARIDVVAVGAADAPPAMVAAAREAMLNAARHVGGDVSVYLEVAGTSIDVFVRDRGPGVDLASLPADRLGIRESIIGRMQRAGGTATVRASAGGGTEVHLHLEETA